MFDLTARAELQARPAVAVQFAVCCLEPSRECCRLDWSQGALLPAYSPEPGPVGWQAAPSIARAGLVRGPKVWLVAQATDSELLRPLL